RLANMQASAMNLLAYEHAQGNISLEQYIAAGQQVQAINEDSLAGYQAVAGVVQEATNSYGGLSAATADLPGAMHDAATAALETAAAQEEMARRAAEAWETFAGNVQTGVANALEAYKSGNVEMLADQQRALGEMLWNQTDQMQGMGQITNDQAMEMKSALAGEFGIVVDETKLATDELLKLFNDWASGGQTAADDVVDFIQNIGTESATLKANAEGDIAAQIAAWQDLQSSTDTSSQEIISLTKELGAEVDENGNIVETALGEAGGAATMMAGDVESASTRAVTAIDGISRAIENLPEYKKVEIEVEKTGDEAFDFGSPNFRFYYALERLVDYADAHPVEIDVASRMDGGMGLGAAAMTSLAPVTSPTPVSGGMYDQRQYSVSLPVTAVQDALDIEQLAQRVVALIRNRA
ncbi:MAG: hypothetical protein JXR84_22305, partial [Anaerolineae bacterium]|nr:hypothetical protein [Anaerolineae bacterium]